MAIGKLLSPWLLRRRPHGTAARPDITKRGKQRPYGLRHSAGPHRRRNVKASPVKIGQSRSVEKWRNYLSPASQSRRWAPPPLPERATASSGSRIASSSASVHGGLMTMRPHAESRLGSRGAATLSSARKIFGMPLLRSRRANASGAARSLIGYQPRNLPLAHL